MVVGILRHLRSGEENEFLAAQAASQAMKGHRGFRERHVLRDGAQSIFVSLGIWEPKEDHEAASPDLRKHMAEQFRAGRSISDFEDETEEVHLLTPVQSVRG